jgi:hypothetical protein
VINSRQNIYSDHFAAEGKRMKTKVTTLGNLGGLKLLARPSALPALLLLWAGLSLLGLWLIQLPLAGALVGGLAAALLHNVSELWHQLGHAAAARSTGHPMSGVLFWGFLATSLYPNDEGRLPAGVHVRRALGGPLASLLLALLAGLIALALRPWQSVVDWLAVFLALDNFLVFTLGALAPLGFTDGSTLLHWLKK